VYSLSDEGAAGADWSSSKEKDETPTSLFSFNVELIY